MALENTDMLAVYRETEKKNYRVTVSQILAKTPAPVAPSLNAVLGTGNTSDNIDIIVRDANLDEQVKLTAIAPSSFKLGLTSDGDVKIGETVKVILEPTGVVTGNQVDLFGNITDGTAFAVYEVGTTVDNKATQTKTVQITNTGAANFNGPLEAESIDGGVYATDE